MDHSHGVEAREQGGFMDEMIRNTTSQLTPGDLAALMAYLRSLPPLADEPR
jgi:hypothetical protein